MVEIEQTLQNFFKKQNGVLTVILFGSFGKNLANERSDVDVAVLFDKEFVPDGVARLELQQELADSLHKDVDCVVLNQAHPVLKHEIFKSGKIILQNDQTAYNDFWTKSLTDYFDLKILREKVEAKMSGGRIHGQ